MAEQIECPRCHGTGVVKSRSRTEPIKNWLRDKWAEYQEQGKKKADLACDLGKERQFIPGMPPGKEWVSFNADGWRRLLIGIDKQAAPDESQGGEG